MKMKTKAKAKKKATPQAEQIEAINVTISVERLAGWTREEMEKFLVGEISIVGAKLGGDHGPRFIVAPAPTTIVEMPGWKTIDIEPK
jgi:hypothetical protein